MTYYFGLQCTCHLPYWQKSTAPCPVHGYSSGWSWTTTISSFTFCKGRHCSHDAYCRGYTVNGA